jgi:hypothetical protein
MIEDEPIDQKSQPPLPSVPVMPKRFISVVTDAIQDEYMSFKDGNLTLSERSRAGIRLLSMAVAELKHHGRTERSEKLSKFLKAYVPPRWRSTITKTTNDVPVYRIFIGGATESTIDVTIQDFQAALKAVENQMYEETYKVLARIVGGVLMELAELGVVDEKPPSLLFSFEHLTAPLEETEETAEDEEKLSEDEDDA